MSPTSATPFTEVPHSALLAGFGATNRAVAQSLVKRGHRVIVFDDRPDHAGAAAAAEELGLELEVAPSERRLRGLTRAADVIIPTPGLPESHPVLAVAEALNVPTAGEFDLARVWDSRPMAAVTGTSAKTTVTEMAVAALRASGVTAVAAGNNEVPLVAAIENCETEVFVVEASSFRLAHSQCLPAAVACWVNFAPDHLDVHRDLASYESAKARIWQCLPHDGIAIANREDPVVMGNLRADRPAWTFAVGTSADWSTDGDMLVGPTGTIMSGRDLRRAMPHDIANALAAAATATPVGATREGLQEAFAAFEPGAHRLQWVASIGGVDFYDDSKATTPHATLAAVRGLDSVVLIAGGRNKGMDLRRLLDGVEHIYAVVALGEAAEEVATAFERERPVRIAAGMDEAVSLAASFAEPGMAVLLSPACASFDAYSGYAERGTHFTRIVQQAARPGSDGMSK